MRIGFQAPVGTTPTENFVRSYQFKMPHTSVKKFEVPNPTQTDAEDVEEESG